jgi:SOS-response transcriptional repressor LexA
MTINTRILKLLEQNGIKQSKLCQEAGIPPSSFSEAMQGKYDWKLSHVMKISEYFKVSVDWLLYGNKKYGVIKGPEIKYVPLDEVENQKSIRYNEYPVLSYIPAGIADVKIQDNPAWESIDFDPRKYFWLKVDNEYGYSMFPFLRPNEKILCAYHTAKFNDGDMVAVLYDKTKGAVKILNRNHDIKDLVILDSLNPSERTISLRRSQITAIYKVVLIAKI